MMPDEIRDGKQIDSQREPDASSKHRQARYPGVIIEVCYSQKGRCVSHLADEYILNTDGSVNAVVAVDIDYKGSKKATITVWRPEYATLDGKEELQATATIDALPFRTDCGLPIEETALRLSLRDFATQELSQELTLRIPRLRVREKIAASTPSFSFPFPRSQLILHLPSLAVPAEFEADDAFQLPGVVY